MAIDITINETIDLVDITVNPNIIEVNVTRTSGGGGGTQTLAQTLVIGKHTGGNNIIVDNADAIELENTSLLKKGTYDFGGTGGISRICSVGYEDMWQSGIRHVFDNNGFIRHSTNCFNYIPDISYDSSLRFKVGSLWTLDDGTTYVCTDASVGASVWEIYTANIPNLTQVLLEGGRELVLYSENDTYVLENADKSRLLYCRKNTEDFVAVQFGIQGGIFEAGDTIEFISSNIDIFELNVDVDISGLVVLIYQGLEYPTGNVIQFDNNGIKLILNCIDTNTFELNIIPTYDSIFDQSAIRIGNSFTAVNSRYYTTYGGTPITVTDPTSENGKGYIVHVVGATATIGSVGYTAGDLVYRYYNGSSWISTNMNSTNGVTSVGLTMPSAFSVTNSPITSSGDIAVTAIGSASQYVRGDGQLATFPTIPTNTSDLINDGDDGISHFITLNDLPSNIIVYPTTVASDISTYFKLVSSITDPSYNTTAVDVSTGAITTTDQLISSLATSTNFIVGNPGVFNITTIGNISKVSGSGEAEFYFRVYKRTLAGTETLIVQSSNTIPVINTGYSEFSATGLWNDGTFLSTDRIVIKYYANRIAGGSNPTYQFQFGGITPVRTLLPIPLTVVPTLSLDGLSDVTISTVADKQLLAYDSATLLWKNKTVVEDTIVDAVTDKAPSQNAVFDALQFTRRLIANGTGSVTGTTAETIITSLTIPANTLDSKCFIWSTMDYFKPSVGTCILRLYVNTSNSLSGATQIGLNTLGSNRNTSFNRKLYLNGTTLDFLVSSTGSQSSNEFIEGLFVASTTATVNPANDIFLIYTTTNDAVGTVATAKQATVQKMKLN